ncbi:4-alpha-glucanotransferase [Pontibacter ummariensis]|uniref:4-alpha-glucanotransferase n=1 Tax=Pontibacter ummariensis TaxID=1610492 RepID=A0A239INB6_9BACT|nr:4-alpha-glucanotransferase [Pontibacter ummariensis]PRY09725.1 4-alpha-glucanotransferase [Pontibacter ummariensis]SNS95031.1 4-alpha-glucanotransferase [Pontibacter ummariensis]
MIIPQRSAGLLLHITSLPSRFGIGDLGPEAYHFADQLKEAGQRYWQILPLNPTEGGYGNSPYSSHSAFAGNPLLISPELLVQDGLLQEEDLETTEAFEEQRVDYDKVTRFKLGLWRKAFENFKKGSDKSLQEENEAFQKEHRAWLLDFTYFAAFKKRFEDRSWVEWPDEIKQRDPQSLKELAQELSEEIAFEEFLQFLFYRQWEHLKQHCHKKEICFFGDMPFYVSHDSADVWANPRFFKLDEEGRATAVSGVPPDFFSETGQLWGTPVFNWEELAKDGYKWWLLRLDHNLRLFGLLRLDHFRAFSAYWEVPASEETAINGKWAKSPGSDILQRVQQKHPEMPIIAEDLGEIDQPVRDLIKQFDLPGMLVLVFAFGDDKAFESSFIPHNHVQNSVVYTGTHDNSTVRAWFEEAKKDDKNRLSEYTFHKLTKENVHEVMNRLALGSVAQLAVLPVQDVLGLGKEAIMNKPSTANGNWEWRLKKGQFSDKYMKELRDLTRIYGR